MEFNKHPNDEYAPSGTRKSTHSSSKEGITFKNDPERQQRDTKQRRSQRHFQALNGKVAEDIVENEAPITFGRYKWKDGASRAITQQDPEKWVENCEVWDVPNQASLEELIRRGAKVSAKERARVMAGVAREDPNAPILLPLPDTTAVVADDEVDVQGAPTAVESKKRSPKRKAKKSASPEAEWSSSKRGSHRKTYAKDGDFSDDGSEIIVTQRAKTPPPPSKRRGDKPPEFPKGL